MQDSLNDLMNKAKELLKDEMTTISYATWIENITIFNIVENNITLKVMSDFQKDAIETRYYDLIVNTFKYLTNKNIVITVIIASEEEPIEEDTSNVTFNTYSNEQNRNTTTFLNPKYTFDSFVVGNNNRLAHAAALAVAESPAAAYNPLFLYGGVGLGKTHLMHSIGNFVLKNNKNLTVLYVTSEKFTNELINAIKDAKNEAFRKKYRSIDVLLIDDIQFIAGKERIQEEFFHTFNELHENGKQIILSSDKPPKDINNLEDRLKSRFDWGLITDISTPDYETRLAILRKKAQSDHIIVEDSILSNIATKIDSNIRELEGALNKLIAFSSLTNTPISMEMAEKAINDIASLKEKVLSAEYIQEIVSKYFNISIEDLNSAKRSYDIAYPRQIAMYLCREVAKMSFPKIGEAFGKRDHSTVMHANNKIIKELETNADTKRIVESVKNIILNKE